MSSPFPAKSQALHNFALSPLKWKNNHPRGRNESRSKILIRIPAAMQKDEQEEGELQEGGNDDSMGKAWNLRPRKPIKKSLNVNGGGGKVELKGKNDALEKGNMENEKKEKKVKFSICLTSEEIEEDVYSLSGSKPTRRPKKRAKVVQKQLDNLFPGLWLRSITQDSYRVSENYMKG